MVEHLFTEGYHVIVIKCKAEYKIKKPSIIPVQGIKVKFSHINNKRCNCHKPRQYYVYFKDGKEGICCPNCPDDLEENVHYLYFKTPNHYWKKDDFQAICIGYHIDNPAIEFKMNDHPTCQICHSIDYDLTYHTLQSAGKGLKVIKTRPQLNRTLRICFDCIENNEWLQFNWGEAFKFTCFSCIGLHPSPKQLTKHLTSVHGINNQFSKYIVDSQLIPYNAAQFLKEKQYQKHRYVNYEKNSKRITNPYKISIQMMNFLKQEQLRKQVNIGRLATDLDQEAYWKMVKQVRILEKNEINPSDVDYKINQWTSHQNYRLFNPSDLTYMIKEAKPFLKQKIDYSVISNTRIKYKTAQKQLYETYSLGQKNQSQIRYRGGYELRRQKRLRQQEEQEESSISRSRSR